MFYDAELIFLKDILNKYHLRTCILNPDDNMMDIIDSSLVGFLNMSGDKFTFNEMFPMLQENTIYKFTDILMCSYYFLLLPDTDKPLILSIGPYLKRDINRTAMLERAESLNLDPRGMGSLEYYLGNTPLIHDEGPIFAVICTLADKIWGGPQNYTVTDLKGENLSPFQSFDLKNSDEQSENSAAFNMKIMEQRYAYENELMSAVSGGLTHKVELLLTNFSEMAFEKRTADPLRNVKNYCIIMNTLLRKAAENGGVHPLYIDSVSSDYAKKIEELASVEQTGKFMVEIFRAYCNLVKNHSISKYSSAVQKTIVAVDADLTADLSLKAMAELNNVSAGYLSSLFKKETGLTLTDFVNKRRMKMAKKLLATTNLQIQTVAGHCGILDVQYFTKMFKRYEGQTPKEFRASL